MLGVSVPDNPKADPVISARVLPGLPCPRKKTLTLKPSVQGVLLHGYIAVAFMQNPLDKRWKNSVFEHGKSGFSIGFLGPWEAESSVFGPAIAFGNG